jgi:hypothetical protein
VRRTPVCALLGPYKAAEWFATTHDVYLVLGELPEDANDHDTADGRPATRAAAHARLARMVCADIETTSEGFRLQLARDIRNKQVAVLREALECMIDGMRQPPALLILAGSGEFLAREVVTRAKLSAPCLSLTERLGRDLSVAACAYAVAILASEEVDAAR